MAKFVLTDASITVGGTDLSDDVQSIEVSYEAEAQECTTMGDDTREQLGGLKNWSVTLNFVQDFASAQVDATLFSAVGTQVALVIKPTSGAVSTTNPSFSGTGLLTNYNPIGNSVGETAIAPATFVAAGTLTRATS